MAHINKKKRKKGKKDVLLKCQIKKERGLFFCWGQVKVTTTLVLSFGMMKMEVFFWKRIIEQMYKSSFILFYFKFILSTLAA